MINLETLVARGATYKNYKAGDVIFQEGNCVNFYHQLVEGSVKWVNIDDRGREFIQFFINPNESFGELPLFDGKPYAGTAIAVEDSIVLRLHNSEFINLLREDPDLHFAFSSLLAERVRFKIFILKEMVHQSPERRVSSLLDFFREDKKNICKNCNQLQLTRQQIADITGLRVETVIRTIRNLHEKGELQIDKGKVYLTSSNAIKV